MYQRRKKFTEEVTPENRLSDRWDQQVFYLTRQFPQAQSAIVDIVNSHAKRQGCKFIPNEEALVDLEKLICSFKSPN